MTLLNEESPDRTPATALGDALQVPANSSRFFTDRDEALAQPLGEVSLAWREDDPYLYNSSFDPTLVRYDTAYCTTSSDSSLKDQIHSHEYFDDMVLPHLPERFTAVDVGCGQGEFVEYLREKRIDVAGFDPVLRRSTPYLHARFWTPDEHPADLVVMRCVLPHIQSPWQFIDQMAESCPEALLLVEFQAREWIFDKMIWQQLSHDHVNIFSIDDFTRRYDVVASGLFGRDEWAFVLLRVNSSSGRAVPGVPPVQAVGRVVRARNARLQELRDLGRPVAIWGAAGKGIVIAHSLVQAGVPVEAAVDIDPHRQHRYMEVSGTLVLPPEELASRISREAVVLVSNPNHRAYIEASGLLGRRELVVA